MAAEPFDMEPWTRTLAPLGLSSRERHDLAVALRQPTPCGIRLRPGIDAADLPFASQPVPWHPRGRWVDSPVRPGAFIHYAAGAYYIQDPASLLAAALADVRGGEWVCDLCAAPGGKATALLEDLGDAGWLVANEAVRGRVPPLQFNLARHGGWRFLLTNFDPDTLADRAPSLFDAVLADVPCSGQSLVARGKQSWSAFEPRTVAHCAARQTRILEAAARLARPGGRIVYATCTFAYDENEGQIERFLASHPDWTLVPDERFRQWESSARAGTYRLWPHRDRCGGAFAAVLKHRPTSHEQPAPIGEDASASVITGSCASRRRPREASAAKGDVDFTAWGRWRRKPALHYTTDRIFGWSEPLPAPLAALPGEGPEVAFRKHSTWFPSYALAMRRDPNWLPRQVWALTDDEAADYVQGATVTGDISGWAVATWNEQALGWLKGNGKQGKNHLPKAGRIHVEPPSTVHSSRRTSAAE